MTFVSAVLCSCAIASGTFIYWTVFDSKAPMKHTAVALLDSAGQKSAAFHPGDSMIVSRTACIYDEGLAVYTRKIVCASEAGENQYYMPGDTLQLAPSCGTSYNKIQIPAHAAPGRCQYVVTVTFANNPLVHTTQTLPVPDFNITP